MAAEDKDLNQFHMKKSTAIFIQAVIVLIGVGAAAFLLWEPHVEGRNAHATLFDIYFKDPFLAYAYLGSTPFFMALFQAFKLVGHAKGGAGLPPEAPKALRTIRYCALALIGFVALGEVFIILSVSDDRAGGVFMGLLVASGSGLVAAAAARLGRILPSGEEKRLPRKETE